MSLSDARRAVSVLAELAPSGEQSDRRRHDITDRVIIPLDALRFLRMPMSADRTAPLATGRTRAEVIDLVKRARLHGEESDLRVGWLWLTLPAARGGQRRVPLVSARVTASVAGADGIFLNTILSSISLARTGDIELTELVVDDDERERLESTVQLGTGSASGVDELSMPPGLLAHLPELLDWSDRAVRATGHDGARVVTVEPSRVDEPVVVAQIALYLEERTDSPAPASTARSLHEWARLDIDGTAFAGLYATPTATDAVMASTAERNHEHADASDDEDVVSSLVLTEAQEAVVRSARHEATTVVSGPPGSGKTQTVIAAALDVVERGGSVLIAGPSHAAVEALTDLLTETPGPDPVVFGDASRRAEVADRLGQGGGELLDRRAVQHARTSYRRADAAHRDQHQAITDVLEAERMAADHDPVRTFRARQLAPGWFEATADHGRAAHLLDAATRPGGWLAGFRRRRALRSLQAHAASTADCEALRGALALARAERAAHQLVATGGIDLEPSWSRLVVLDAERREALGRLRYAMAHDAARVDRRARATMGAVAAALRSGRARRRRRLGTIDGADMVDALPLWIGTLRDVDDLLPRTPAMFDLVIVDETSQVDQIQAAPALLRARRSMLVGDPKQLRHVSFLSDEEIAAATRKKGADGGHLAHILDVRRVSLFDVGAATARTRFLDEHFRSTPHLIDFSSGRFYDGRLHVSKRHPANHAHDHIHVRRVGGRRTEDGVNDVEVRAVIGIVAEIADGLAGGTACGSVGIVTPSRAQADRLEEVALETFDLGVIEALRLRIGTVHGFQGCERDLVVISLALDDDSPAGSRSFVANANLFNVMVTRARETIHVVTSLSAVDGTIGDYLQHAETPPRGPIGSPHANPLVERLASDVRSAGIPVVTRYPAGRHDVDLVVGDGSAAFAVHVGVHPDGAEAHIGRELTLRRFGWSTTDAFASRWADRDAELALELTALARSRATSTVH